MVTFISMWKERIITKEKRDNFCLGKRKTYGEQFKESVADDLESLLEDIRRGEQPDDLARTYFLPRLTEQEMELVQKKDTDYFNTFTTRYLYLWC